MLNYQRVRLGNWKTNMLRESQRTLWAWARQAASNSGPASVAEGTCQSACTSSRSETWTSNICLKWPGCRCSFIFFFVMSFLPSTLFFVSLFVFFCFVCRQADDLRLRIWIICTSRSLISPLRNLERLHLHQICTPSIGFTLNGTCTRSWDASTHVLGLHMTYNSAFPCGVLCKHSSK